MTQRRISVQRLGVSFLGIVLLALSVTVFLQPKVVQAYVSATALNNYLPDAENTIVSVETSAQIKNFPCGSSRNCLNSSGLAYWSKLWISPDSQPVAGQQLTLPSTTRSVNLQLNSFWFLTAATVGKSVGSTTGLGTVRYTYPENRVTNANYPDDRLPAQRPQVNDASIRASRSKVYSAAVVSGGGSLSNVQVGQVFGTVIDSNSRYAFGNAVKFTYNSGNWTGLRRDVTIRFKIATINTFHSAPPGGTSTCYDSRGALINPVGSNEFDRCVQYYVDYTFTFFVVPVWYLNPSISLSDTQASPGETVTAMPTVNNTADGDSSGTYWTVSSMTYLSGATPPSTTAATDNYGQSTANKGRPCAYFVTTGASNCKTESSGISNYKPGVTNLSSIDALIGDYPFGTKVCYVLSVFSRDNSELDVAKQVWAHSAPACVVVSKKPKVQVQGGDLSVGRVFSGNTVVSSSVNTSTSRKTVNGSQVTFGSWVEYGMFATGSIAGMGSGSAFAGSGLSTAGLCDYSTLSFSNTDVGASACTSSSKIGYYQSNQSMPNVAASFPVTATTPSLGNNPTINMNGGNPQGLYTATGNVSINGGGVNKGQWFVLNAPTANVTITGNMNYTNATLHSIQDIPQVVIIAKNITINESVTNIDAWLIANGGNSPADGKLNTCGAVGAPAVSLVVAQCNQLLTVNGPVMAQRLYLNRTGGSGTGPTSGDPAEIFNLRPDAYLWGYARATSNGQVQTVYSNELPPRF